MASATSRLGVLIVDDSALIRRIVRDAIASTDDLQVVGEATNGLEALHRIHELRPDLVTLDIDMPSMGGLDALGYIMSECPRPVVVLSGYEPAQGGDLTIRALELGAVDFVRKPSWDRALDVETLRHRLLQALREAGQGRVAPLVPTVVPSRRWRRTPRKAPAIAQGSGTPAQRVIGVAASTGGPKTLAELLPRIAPEIDAAIVVVQHMPAGFTASLAQRLHELGPRPVHEACEGMPVLSGQVYVAPGGLHLKVRSGGDKRPVFLVDDTPPEQGVRPSADVTLRSLVGHFGSACTALILTGMGRDGAAGSALVRAAGGHVLVQDPESCVVSGMSQAAMALGVVDAVLGIDDLPAALLKVCATSPVRR